MAMSFRSSCLFAFLPESNQINKSNYEPVCQSLQFTGWHVYKAANDLYCAGLWTAVTADVAFTHFCQTYCEDSNFLHLTSMDCKDLHGIICMWLRTGISTLYSADMRELFLGNCTEFAAGFFFLRSFFFFSKYRSCFSFLSKIPLFLFFLPFFKYTSDVMYLVSLL